MFLFWLRARTGKPTAFQMMAAKVRKKMKLTRKLVIKLLLIVKLLDLGAKFRHRKSIQLLRLWQTRLSTER